MIRSLGCLCVLITPLMLTADDKDDVKKELKALEGKWKVVGLEAGGMQYPKDKLPDFIYIVGPNGKATGKTPAGDYEATMTVDPKKNPKTIENSHESGASKGKKQHGIYKLEGDKWTVCMTRPGAMESDRPKDFDTKGSTGVVFIFERVKEEKKP